MKKILIVVDTSRASGRKFLAGAERYISALANWEVYIKPPSYLAGKKMGFDLGFPLEKLDGLLIRDAVNILNILSTSVPKVVSDTHREFIPGVFCRNTFDHGLLQFHLVSIVSTYYIMYTFATFYDRTTRGGV